MRDDVKARHLIKVSLLTVLDCRRPVPYNDADQAMTLHCMMSREHAYKRFAIFQSERRACSLCRPCDNVSSAVHPLYVRLCSHCDPMRFPQVHMMRPVLTACAYPIRCRRAVVGMRLGLVMLDLNNSCQLTCWLRWLLTSSFRTVCAQCLARECMGRPGEMHKIRMR